MVLGQGLGLEYVGGGGGGRFVPTNPLLFAEVQARGPSSRANFSGKDAFLFNAPIAVAGNHEAFVVSFTNFYPASGTSLAGVGNDLNIAEAYLIAPDGTAFQVEVSGSGSFTIANNEDELRSDPIILSGYGDTDGEDWWIKGHGTIATSGYIPVVNIQVADCTDSQTGFFITGGTTLSASNVLGPFTTTGTGPSYQSVLFKPMLKGYPVDANHQAVIAFGDSMTDGDGDNTSNGIYGRGQLQRATTISTGQKRIACANFAKSGSSFQMAVDNTQFDIHIQTATIGWNSYGTNNVDPNSLAQMQSYDDALNAKLTAGGVTTILRQELAMRTNSTDDWATLVNQTPINANWNTGGKVKQFNDGLAADVGVTITEVVSYSRIREATNYTLWPIPKLYNADSTHLNTNGAQTMGYENRAYLLNYINTVTPEWFSSLYSWLDASDTSTITASSGLVTAWADKTANGYSATASGGGRPTTGTRTVNGLNGLDFIPNNFMNWALPTTLPNGPSTYFVVLYNDTPASQGWPICGFIGGSPYYGFDIGSFGPYYMRAFNGAANSVQNNLAPSTSGPHTYVFTRSGVNQAIYLDNAQSTVATNAANTAVSAYYIGREPNGGYANGILCEIPLYNRSFSVKEINVFVNKCLNPKWGTTWTNF